MLPRVGCALCLLSALTACNGPSGDGNADEGVSTDQGSCADLSGVQAADRDLGAVSVSCGVGTASTCGDLEQACCATGAACASGLTCTAGRCQADSGFTPSWVPTTAWKWTDIPGTRFSDYMKNDGGGIAPATGAEPTGGGNAPTYDSYLKQTSFGGPAYSRKHHELYLFGGGHAATTLNALSRWNLGKDVPDMTLLCAPTDATVRQTYWTDATVRASGYWPDGKPKSAHMYHALQYLDSIDELVAIGLAYGVDPVTDSRGWPTVAAFRRGDAAWRPAGTWPDLPPESYERAQLADAPTFAAWDGSSVFYYRDGDGSGPWRKLDGASHTIKAVGGQLGYWGFMQGAARHDQPQALLVGGEPGGGSGYQFKLLDLTSGQFTAMTAAGYAFPSDCQLKDLVWVSTYGYWVAWFVDAITDNDPIGVQRLIKFQQTGPTVITASVIATTGTPPVGNGGCKQGMYWDEAFRSLIFVGNMTESLKAMRAE